MATGHWPKPYEMAQEFAILKKSLGKAVLKNEIILLNKWIYKNKNQHRRSDYFHKLSSVQKHLKKFLNINLITWTKEYIDHKQDFLEAGCFKMLHAFALLEKTKSEIMIAYIAFKRQVELTYFMSISVFAMGILARIQFLIQEILENIKNAYEALLPIKSGSMRLPNAILSFKEFVEWEFSKENLVEKDLEGSSSDSEPDDQTKAINSFKVESPTLSDEFWSKRNAKSKVVISKKRKNESDVSSKKNKVSKIKDLKKKDDLDLIFGKLG